MRISPLLLAAVAVTGCMTAQEDASGVESAEPAVHAASNGPAGTKTKSTNLVDHGGTVLAKSTTYAIYWGTPGDFPSDLEGGMASLLSGLNGSSYLGIAGQYMRGAAISTAFAGSYSDLSAPPKSAPNTAALATEVCKLFPSPDPDALYIVFTSNAPNINYCAWHNKASCNGVTFQVAYVPNQAKLPSCSPYTAANLGCNSYSDGTVSSADSVAHEFMEAITDAHIDAWYDANKLEVADKCEYQYSACVTLAGGSWQIQSEWSNALGACQQQ